MKLTAILATGPLGEIGHKGSLPWPRMGRDLRRFREATMGKLCVVGRKTHETLPPLRGRRIAVLSACTDLGSIPSNKPLDRLVRHPDEIAALFDKEPEVMVIGGAEVYRALLPRCDRLLLTVVHGTWPADTFVERPTEGFTRLSVETHDPEPDSPARVTFSEWVRP